MNIGIALVTNPRVLFLDEPTSGLDSYTSNEVMTVVKTLTKTGITICATIHNPTPYCFNLFDRLMILLHGRVVYSGENGVQRAFASAVRLGVPALPLHAGCAELACRCQPRALTRSPLAGPAAVRYFEQFPEVTPFGQRGSFHNKVPPAAVAPSVSRCLADGEAAASAGAASPHWCVGSGQELAVRVSQAEWIVDLTTRADREGKHADYANRYDRSDLKVANLKELNMQIDRGYRVSARPQPALPCMVARCSASWWFSSALAVLLHACRAGLSGWLAWLQVSDEQLKELAVRTETTNPWYWGIRTLAKVGSRSWAGCISGGVQVSI